MGGGGRKAQDNLCPWSPPLTSNSSIRPEVGERKDVAWMDAEALIWGWTCLSKGFSSDT